MANTLSVYDVNNLSEAQQKQIAQYKQAYADAQASGDKAGMESAHAAAEQIRASAGYSGGDGSQYIPLDTSSSYTAPTITGYQAQTEAVNNQYDAAQELALAQLKNAYDTNLATLEAEQPKIKVNYQAAKNQTAAEAEREKAAFNESAAASGVNSGLGSQAALSMNNTLQSNLSGLNQAEAQANTDLNNQIAQLKVSYQNSIATAVAQNDYERAAALLSEYQKQAASAVDVAQVNAGLQYQQYTALRCSTGRLYKAAE